MDTEKIGALIARLRAERGLTQKALAAQLGVGDKAVSKWETGRGLPDPAVLPQLARALGAELGGLLAGGLPETKFDGGNMKRVQFYVCPGCGNVLTATGGGELSCCGRRLEPLAAREMDETHRPTVDPVEDELYLTFDHPMDKGHALRFVAWANVERLILVKLYPEQSAALRLPQVRGGTLYVCCGQDGLWKQRL